MGKLTVEDAQKASSDISSGLGSICNDAYDAIKEKLSAKELEAIIKRGKAKIAQFEGALANMGEAHARQVKKQYGDKIEGLKEDLGKLEEKLASK